ncbi:AMP-dependent synthetase and ligase [Kribbella flavida DSM 17836]|uniref:AMP-dependent synthetase and ligase n=1 Tax=Kribbella flavida (strain DSM 17836 / JCM 10339 / NBRC 14399) TaxID=479435 RepID=D2PVS4_KRIFD|nr:o-succinylbenzoate--CoA ligase [Kribbella flavida]ADB35314.1 AMP-dependent synthetase and ligase [Kribbella flavida DSM 17836]
MSTLRLVPGTPDAVLSALAAVLDGSGTPFAPLPDDPAAAARARQAIAPDEPLEEDCAVVLTTSGSTGEPKGVLLSREALIASATATHDRLGGAGQWLLPMKPYFVGGLQILTRSILAGTTPVLAGDDFVTAAAAMTGARRYTAMVPTQLSRYLDTATDALRSFDAIVLGGAPMGPQLKARAADAGVTAIPAYGMTETGSGCVYAGLPLAGTELALDDGRILIKGPTLFSGYRLQPALTKEVLQDGWFRTQDRGRFTDGRLEVIGRLDDVVISGGVNVTLPAVQARLVQHPGVRDAAVLGVPDPEWGSRVVAFVVGEVEPAELRDFVAEALPRTWAPREVVQLAELPMLASGKVDRQRLLDGVR